MDSYIKEKTVWIDREGKGVGDEGSAINATPIALLASGVRVAYLCGSADPVALARQGREAGLCVGGNQLADRWVVRLRSGSGSTLTLLPISRWLGTQDVTPYRARSLMLLLGSCLRQKFGQRLCPTPAETGFWCWAGTSGYYPRLPDGIRSAFTGTQGRFQVCPAGDTIPALYCYDLRLGYLGAAMWVGSSPEWRHDDVDEFLGYTPARYLIRFHAPSGWDHVGLLPAPGYPLSGECWADASEVRIALDRGWRVKILERLYAVLEPGRKTFRQPLRTWGERLTALREELSGPPAVSEADGVLLRAAVRNVALHAIGLMAGRNLYVTRAVERPDGEWASWADVPGEAIRGSEREEGEDILYQAKARAPRGAFDHPELAHQVWGRCRSWLLHRKYGGEYAGALTLPREQVVGFAQDALYLTAPAPWPDLRDRGYRLKGVAHGPFPAPRNRAELLSILGEEEEE